MSVVERFKSYLEGQRTRQGDTLRHQSITTYIALVRPLQQSLERLLEDEDYEGIVKLFNQRLSSTTSRNYRSAFKHFLQMLGAEPEEADRLLVEVTNPDTTVDDLMEKTMSYQELNMLYHRTSSTWWQFIISFLYDTALRQSTARRLLVKDIVPLSHPAVPDDEEESMREKGVAAKIEVERKGGKNGTVYVTPHTMSLFVELKDEGRWDRYDDVREAPIIRFFKRDGTEYANQTSTFTKKFKEHCEDKLNMEDGYTPHSMRHTAITHLVDNEDMRPRDVQHYAGHSDLETTERYVLASERFSKRAFNGHNSVADL